MGRSHDRLLTTHVGSLIRPPALTALLRRRESGEDVDTAVFAECLRASVSEVARAQADIGLDIINDGEFGKTISWSRYVVERVSGVVRQSNRREGMPAGVIGKERRDFAEFYAEYDHTQNFSGLAGWQVNGAIKYVGQEALQRDIACLKGAVADQEIEDAFMTAVAPGSVIPDRDDRYYPDDETFLFAVADALHEEYQAIVDAGLVLQIDDAYLATTYDVIVPPGDLRDYRRWAELRVEALNRALHGLPEERTRYHVCWGSWNGPHVTDVPFKEIADIVLRVRVGGYALEMANPRHEHEWRVWETVKLPECRMLLPGVISHSTNVVEHPEVVSERLVRLARLVGRENIIASTDCGFAQGPFVRRVHPSIMWAKLQALVEGARLASIELWGQR
jgi:5-methyltetrahydropteroyltriglutamate--homocysteine methyltransferase